MKEQRGYRRNMKRKEIEEEKMKEGEKGGMR